MRTVWPLLIVGCASCGARTPLFLGDQADVPDASTITPSCAAAPSAVLFHSPRQRPSLGPAPELDLTGDGQRIYIVDGFAGLDAYGATLFSLDPCTGSAIDLGFDNLGDWDAVFAFGGQIYFGLDMFSGDDVFADAPLGGTPTQIASVQGDVAAFAVDSQNVYSVGTFEQGVFLNPRDGGAQLVIAPRANPTIPVVDDASVFFAMAQGIEQFDKLGNVVQTLFPAGQVCTNGPDTLRVLAGDATAVYASMTQPSGVWRVPKDGTAPTELVATTSCGQIAIDDAYVYLSEPSQTALGGSVVERVQKGGGAKEVVSAAANPHTLYVDSRSVYWSESEGGVWKIDK